MGDFACTRCGKRRWSSNPKADQGAGTLCSVCDFDDPRHPQVDRTHPNRQEHLR